MAEVDKERITPKVGRGDDDCGVCWRALLEDNEIRIVDGIDD